MSFQDVLTQAVQYFVLHGYDDPKALANWMKRLRDAAVSELGSEKAVEARMKQVLEATFKRSLTTAAFNRSHPDIPRYTIERIKPNLRPELTRRILASADLIKLNRSQAIEKTLQRFSGWASSVPAGGSRVVEKVDVKADVSKSLRQLKYEERRVTIDQGHKLVSSINQVIAHEGGAIAGKWRDHGSVQAGYDARHDHLERNGKYFVYRGNWAIEQGLMNKGEGYTDEIEMVGELPFCRCYYVNIYNLRDLPSELITEKGRAALESTRVAA